MNKKSIRDDPRKLLEYVGAQVAIRELEFFQVRLSLQDMWYIRCSLMEALKDLIYTGPYSVTTKLHDYAPNMGMRMILARATYPRESEPLRASMVGNTSGALVIFLALGPTKRLD